MQEILRFTIIGTIGFAADSMLFLFLFSHINAFFSRIGSFMGAVIITFFLNCYFTFNFGLLNSFTQWRTAFIGYLSGQTVGFFTNITTFSALLWLFEPAWFHPLVFLMVSSLIALFVNFILAKRAFQRATAPLAEDF